MLILLVLFVILPLAELALLILIGQWIGLAPTVVMVFVTGLIGATLAKWQGLQVYRKLRKELAAGRMPGGTMFEGVLILIAGAVLITPGVLTDLFGFALLIPPFRKLVVAGARRWAERRFKVVTVAPQGPIKEAEVYSVRTEGKEPAAPQTDEPA